MHQAPRISIHEFLSEQRRGLPVVDVRSPGEFAQGHIPGAVNISLFDDIQRAEIGTLYKQIGKDVAVERGLEMVGPKLADFVRQAKKLGSPLLVHCWRGGMRSGSFAWLLNTAGMSALTLEGGYKAYRTTVLDALGKLPRLMVLGGYTGSGKTDVLHELALLGEQVIDLEALAQHKGSAFGGLGQAEQPSSEQFENDVIGVLQHLDAQKRIWIEDEGNSIGKIFLPIQLRDALHQSPTVVLDVPESIRLDRLVDEYGRFPIEALKEKFVKIRKKLGGQHEKAACLALDEGDIRTAARIALAYYDKAYLHALNATPNRIKIGFKTKNNSPKAIAQGLLSIAIVE